MVVSRNKIKLRLRRKTNPELVETISLSLKNKSWSEVSSKLSGSSRAQKTISLGQIETIAKDGESVLIVGKVVSQGNLTKKVKIISLGISESAKEKLKESKSEFSTILEEITKNPKMEKIRVL